MDQPDLAGHALKLGTIVTGLGITQICGWGTIYYSLGALSEDIIAGTGWPKLLVFGAFSASLLLSGIISRSIGTMVDRHGGRRVMAGGSVLAGVGCLLLGLASSPFAYVAGWLVLGPAMRMALYDTAFASLAQIAGPDTRRAISYLSLFGGLASTVFWPLSGFLSHAIGWQNAYLAFAAINLLVCLPIHLALPTTSRPSATLTVATPDEDGGFLSGRERTGAIALFAMVLACNGFVFSSLSAHIVPLFEKLNYSASTGIVLAALIGPSQVASRFAEVLFGRSIGPMTLGLISFGFLPVAFIVLRAGNFSWEGAVLFVVLYGLSNGLVTIVKGQIPLTLFGHAGYGQVLGTLSAPSLILNALAPTLFGVIIDRFGAHNAMALCFAVSLISLAAMVVLARKHPR